MKAAPLQDLAQSVGVRDAGVGENLAQALGGAAGLPLPVKLLAADYAVGRCLGWPLPLYSLGLGRSEAPAPYPAVIARTLLAGADELITLLRPLAARADGLIAAGRQVRTRQASAVIGRILAQRRVPGRPASRPAGPPPAAPGRAGRPARAVRPADLSGLWAMSSEREAVFDRQLLDLKPELRVRE